MPVRKKASGAEIRMSDLTTDARIHILRIAALMWKGRKASYPYAQYHENEFKEVIASGLFSATSLSKITGISVKELRQEYDKTPGALAKGKGGRLAGESLEHIIRALVQRQRTRGKSNDRQAMALAVQAGTSCGMLAQLMGCWPSAVERAVKAGRKELEDNPLSGGEDAIDKQHTAGPVADAGAPEPGPAAEFPRHGSGEGGGQAGASEAGSGDEPQQDQERALPAAGQSGAEPPAPGPGDVLHAGAGDEAGCGDGTGPGDEAGGTGGGAPPAQSAESDEASSTQEPQQPVEPPEPAPEWASDLFGSGDPGEHQDPAPQPETTGGSEPVHGP